MRLKGEVSLRHLVLLLAVCAALGACGGLELNPIVNEQRTVRFERDPSKTVTVIHDLVWEDKSHATEELRLPAGIYALEGEDGDYWYRRSSYASSRKAARAATCAAVSPWGSIRSVLHREPSTSMARVAAGSSSGNSARTS